MFYVYVYRHPDTNIPFWVGKGQGNRLNHWKKSVYANVEVGKLLEQLKESNKQPIVETVFESDSEELVLNEETKLIELYGRQWKGTGSLLNRSSGGGMWLKERSKVQYKPSTVLTNIIDDMIEIADYPGYFITKDGRVWSAPKIVMGGVRHNGKWLVVTHCGGGYLGVSLVKNKRKSTKHIHRLVAITFLKNPEELHDVNHKDGNKWNNHVDNLEWCSTKMNCLHSCDLLGHRRDGEYGSSSILTEAQVLEIRAKYIPRKYTQEMLAKEYCVAESNISAILLRKTWTII